MENKDLNSSTQEQQPNNDKPRGAKLYIIVGLVFLVLIAGAALAFKFKVFKQPRGQVPVNNQQTTDEPGITQYASDEALKAIPNFAAVTKNLALIFSVPNKNFWKIIIFY